MLKNLKLRNKLLLMFCITGLLPILVVGMIAYYEAKTAIQEEVNRGNLIFFEETRDELEVFFANKLSSAKTIVSFEDIYSCLNTYVAYGSDSEEWLESYASLEKIFPYLIEEYDFDFAFLTDTSGKMIYITKSADTLVGTDLSGRSYLQSTLQGNATWSEVFFSDVVNQNIMVLNLPILSEGQRGTLVGTVGLAFDQRQIDAIVHVGIQELGMTGDAYLINRTDCF